MLEQFKKIGQDALTDLKKVTDLASLEEFRIKYLGRKGQIIQMLSQIGKFPSEEKPKAGQLANKIKREVTQALRWGTVEGNKARVPVTNTVFLE